MNHKNANKENKILRFVIRNKRTIQSNKTVLLFSMELLRV